MSDVFITSDLHISHEKVARFRTRGMVLPRVVGAEIAAHNRMLARNWDDMVGKGDTVWVLGDISSGTKHGQLNALAWIQQRPGIKHLIAGNHDSVHPLHRDSHKWFPAYLEAFYSVQMAAKRRIPLREGHTTALLSHFPYRGDHTGLDRYPEWRLKDAGHYLLHGHTHSAAVGSSHPRQIHVGVDAWGFRPVSLGTIHELIRLAEEAPPRDWEDVPMFEVTR